MTTPNPLALADACFVAAGLLPSEAALERQAVGQAAALLRTQHAALQRKDALLRQALKVINAVTLTDHPVRVALEKELQQ